MRLTIQKNKRLEAVLWLAGLGALALMHPEGQHLFSLCPFSWVWAEGCWGCGLGHAVAYLFRGQWQASWQAHPLALPAILILLRRCWQLLTWRLPSENHLLP
ncbi:DUF2752 domain-containing protein [Pontibacter sp. E15-1]|uniref:DUF2752 domain-containing protein n=1 Tax=Pontibacter sp. E15-1 TaxID=2919918 RepID=UPI001F5039C5|nr:DUF2752 domain-containing protein [Pontibacter sp. E15-1]MCJ8166971.1 DUF2752 domain-containing protein [Pontibacter sp. E15-1]